jgi:hypothetical protein
MLSELSVGIKALANGTISVLRGDKTGALITANTHGQYNESATQGKIMYATNAVA